MTAARLEARAPVLPVDVEIMGLRLVSEANAHEHWRIRQKRAKAQREVVSAVLSTTCGVWDPSDYVRMCVSCHHRMDGTVRNLGVYAQPRVAKCR